MGWRGAAGQAWNGAGVAVLAEVVAGGKGAWAVPHLRVPDIRWIDWSALSSAGFLAALFDKDNTLTLPYVEGVSPSLLPSLESARSAFEGRIAVLSNSAGLQQYDPEGKKAERVEKQVGVRVLRHEAKKPAGGAEAVEFGLGVPADRVVMVGDRLLTDVVFGNRLGLLSIYCAPLQPQLDPAPVKFSRRIEDAIVDMLERRGTTAPPHKLAPNPRAFIKDPACW
eukprot:jgi/Chlat1/6827/Chrsp51S09104